MRMQWVNCVKVSMKNEDEQGKGNREQGTLNQGEGIAAERGQRERERETDISTAGSIH